MPNVLLSRAGLRQDREALPLAHGVGSSLKLDFSLSLITTLFNPQSFFFNIEFLMHQFNGGNKFSNH